MTFLLFVMFACFLIVALRSLEEIGALLVGLASTAFVASLLRGNEG